MNCQGGYGECEASCRSGMALDADGKSAQAMLLKTRLQDLRDAGHPTDEEQDRPLVDADAAAAFKAKGNAEFSGKRFREAITFYTSALAQDPFNHVFYSNRSACFAEEDECEDALRDGARCVVLAPAFAKGYSRKGLALYHLGRYPEAEESAKVSVSVSASASPRPDFSRAMCAVCNCLTNTY